RVLIDDDKHPAARPILPTLIAHFVLALRHQQGQVINNVRHLAELPHHPHLVGIAVAVEFNATLEVNQQQPLDFIRPHQLPDDTVHQHRLTTTRDPGDKHVLQFSYRHDEVGAVFYAGAEDDAACLAGDVERDWARKSALPCRLASDFGLAFGRLPILVFALLLL